ncbi:integrase [Caulobacter radicis]|nr:integrase [Caulobacter radicis]
MPYGEMLSEFARELANTINGLTHHVHRLQAWAQVIAPLPYEEQMEAAHEFIEVLGTAAIGLPYVIKSRLAYAAGHLSHQANMTRKGWQDVFPAKTALYLNDIEPFGAPWKTFRAFKRKVEAIGGKAFRAATSDFRNAYNHRFPPRLVLGVTNIIERASDPTTGKAVYLLGGSAPLQPLEVANLLMRELDLCYDAFEAFQALVDEQTKAIVAFEAARVATDDEPPARAP